MNDSIENLMYENDKYMEGYKAGIMTKVEKLKPHPIEAIVLSIDFNKIDVSNAYNIFNDIKSNFPNNTVVAIPDYLSLKSCSKDVLENIVNMITEIIEEL